MKLLTAREGLCGSSIVCPNELLNFILETNNINFIDNINFIKVLECINKSNFKRQSLFHILLDNTDFEKAKKYFIGDLCREICFTCEPKNDDVKKYYEEFKIQRDKLVELLNCVEWRK